ncbi:hypothetical protein BHE74_00058532 [Ensete ventricosum]|nr:hypothetical protein GW17_00044384 [Ensete ventricosum]RWW36444.1 hypothetical protein BHE74_00058532 [Ensete ventricosum]RZR93240.1 hypothetical protein BHM03_00021700 [Ensete ventricosum]
MPRSEVTVGLGRALARKFCSNSLASWSKEKMEAGPSRLYHIRAGPMKVVAKTRHMSASDESYNAIWAQKAATCSVGSELPSYDSKAGNLKLVGIGLSCISGVKGEPRLVVVALLAADHTRLVHRQQRKHRFQPAARVPQAEARSITDGDKIYLAKYPAEEEFEEAVDTSKSSSVSANITANPRRQYHSQTSITKVLKDRKCLVLKALLHSPALFPCVTHCISRSREEDINPGLLLMAAAGFAAVLSGHLRTATPAAFLDCQKDRSDLLGQDT